MQNIETLLAAVAQTQGFDDDGPVVSASGRGLGDSGSTQVVRGETSESQIIGGVSGDVGAPPPPLINSGAGKITGGGGRAKRGRPPKGQLAAKSQPPKRTKVEDEEEDVCFICFDGGSLVLCDRKGCPKAYHPACIKRDEAFFQSKAKWNCGWHICSVCQKTSHYMCYTCTYSLCKACTKDADYVRVRGNKGFCSICMKTIMLIENKDQANKESVQVDFDDQGSWEYLFKWYWSCLKEGLSLTLSDLTQAKRPCKGPLSVDCKPQLSNGVHAAADGKVSNIQCSMEHLELKKPHAETPLEPNNKLRAILSRIENYEETQNHETMEDEPGCSEDTIKPTIDKVTDEPVLNKASEHPGMKKDQDKPTIGKVAGKLSICSNINNQEADKPIFASSNELISNKDLGKGSLSPASFVRSAASVMEVDGNTGLLAPINHIKQNKRKKSEDRAPSNNLKEYAAIDVHNVSLIYLRLNLMVNLLNDPENFDNKAIGSIVRIRVSPNDQKRVVYRLVQVAGTCKVAEPYKIGEMTANVVLEILNLDKKETVTIDAISDQEFTKEECKRLRQAIKRGFGKRLTVGEVQKTALALKPLRIDEWLEVEIMELNHLRDRASENGRKRRLREYMEKLELLKSPEERQRRLQYVTEIHADWKMNPSYKLEVRTRSADTVNKSANMMPISTQSLRSGQKPITHNKQGEDMPSVQLQSRTLEKSDASGSQSSDKNRNKVNITAPTICGKDNLSVPSSGLPASAPTVSFQNAPSPDNIETEKLWHYRDPHGKIQGPFSMMQLRMWSTTGLFPADMRIWTNHEQYDSLLLTDALNGHLHGESDFSHKSSPMSKENGHAGRIDTDVGTNETSTSEQGVARTNDASTQSGDNSRCEREKERETSWPHCWDLLKDNNPSANYVQANNVHSLSSPEKTKSALPVSCQESDESGRAQRNLSGLRKKRMTGEIQCNGEPTNQPVEVGVRSQEIDLNSNDMEFGSVVSTDSKSPELTEQARNMRIPDVHATSTSGEQARNRQGPDVCALTTSDEQYRKIQIPDLHAPTTSLEQASSVEIPILHTPTTSGEEAGSIQIPDLHAPTTSGEQVRSIQIPDLHASTTSLEQARSVEIPILHAPTTSGEEARSIQIPDLHAPTTSGEQVRSIQIPDLHAPTTSGKQARSIEIPILHAPTTSGEQARSIQLPDLHAPTTSIEQTRSIQIPIQHGPTTSGEQARNIQIPDLHAPTTSVEHAMSIQIPILHGPTTSGEQTRNIQIPDLHAPMTSAEGGRSIQTPILHAPTTLGEQARSIQIPDLHAPITSGEEARSIQIPDLHAPTTSGEQARSIQIPDLHAPTTLDEQARSIRIPDLHAPTASGEFAISIEIPDLHARTTSGEQARNLQVPDLHAPTTLGKQVRSIEVPDLHSPITKTAENQLSICGILELLSPAPRDNNEDLEATETKQPGPLNFPLPDSGPGWNGASGPTVGAMQLPDIADEWPIKPPVHEWDPTLIPQSSSLKPEAVNEYVPTSNSDGHEITHDPPPNPPNMPSWLTILNEPIEFDALGEEYVSDLLAEVDAMASQGASLPSPTSAAKFAREFLEDCKDDCFSSIGDFSPTHDPQKGGALGSTQHIQNFPCKLETFDLDSFRKSTVNSSASSEGETSAPVYSSAAGSEFQPPEPNHTNNEMVSAPMATGSTSDAMDPGWGNVQGNINLVTVQGNVNLVLGGPGQGMPNLNWGTNPGTAWVNPNLNRSPPMNASLPWDGQRKYNSGERYTSPRERGYQGSDSGFGRGRPPRVRQPYNNEGYSWPPPRGQRVCKFYENGRCKKGAYCDYLHP